MGLTEVQFQAGTMKFFFSSPLRRGAIPPLPNTPSWRGAQLKESTGTLPLTFAIV